MNIEHNINDNYAYDNNDEDDDDDDYQTLNYKYKEETKHYEALKPKYVMRQHIKRFKNN